METEFLDDMSAINPGRSNSGTNPAAANVAVTLPARRRRWREVAVALGLLAGVPLLLFVLNGTLLSRGETPYMEVISEAPPDSPDERDPLTIKVLAFNIAKCFAFREGPSFDDVSAVTGRIERIAELIRAEEPDFVFLSEVFTECGPCPVNHPSALPKSPTTPP